MTTGYNDSGYNDIFFIAIRSNGINYACTSVIWRRVHYVKAWIIDI